MIAYVSIISFHYLNTGTVYATPASSATFNIGVGFRPVLYAFVIGTFIVFGNGPTSVSANENATIGVRKRFNYDRQLKTIVKYTKEITIRRLHIKTIVY